MHPPSGIRFCWDQTIRRSDGWTLDRPSIRMVGSSERGFIPMPVRWSIGPIRYSQQNRGRHARVRRMRIQSSGAGRPVRDAIRSVRSDAVAASSARRTSRTWSASSPDARCGRPDRMPDQRPGCRQTRPRGTRLPRSRSVSARPIPCPRPRNEPGRGTCRAGRPGATDREAVQPRPCSNPPTCSSSFQATSASPFTNARKSQNVMTSVRKSVVAVTVAVRTRSLMRATSPK